MVIHLCHFHITNCKPHSIPCKCHPKVNCPVSSNEGFVCYRSTLQHHSHPCHSSFLLLFLYSFFSSFFLLPFLYLGLPLSPSITLSLLRDPMVFGTLRASLLFSLEFLLSRILQRGQHDARCTGWVSDWLEESELLVGVFWSHKVQCIKGRHNLFVGWGTDVRWS